MADDDFAVRLAERFAASTDEATWARLFSPDGLARTCQWVTEDDWIVEYTTTRVRHGRFDGYFCAFLFRPRGKGSRSGRRGTAQRWERVEVRRCKTRKEARAFAVEWYYAHSPRTAARHGYTPKEVRT